MVFDWLAAHWIGLFVFFVIWIVFWVMVFLVGGTSRSTFAQTAAAFALICLRLSNIPFWASVLGLACALLLHFR